MPTLYPEAWIPKPRPYRCPAVPLLARTRYLGTDIGDTEQNGISSQYVRGIEGDVMRRRKAFELHSSGPKAFPSLNSRCSLTLQRILCTWGCVEKHAPFYTLFTCLEHRSNLHTVVPRLQLTVSFARTSTASRLSREDHGPTRRTTHPHPQGVVMSEPSKPENGRELPLRPFGRPRGRSR